VSIVLKAERAAAVDAAVKKLASVAGTETIAGEEGLVCIVAFPTNGKPIITEISQIARDPAHTIEEVRVERGRLDEVFRNITTGRA
jgi:ABC-2 type transport system ATP-binding protein